MKRPIAEAWESFERDVVPQNAHEVQRQEMRRAFYAGARAMLTATAEVATPESGVTRAGLRRELDEFLVAVRRGDA